MKFPLIKHPGLISVLLPIIAGPMIVAVSAIETFSPTKTSSLRSLYPGIPLFDKSLILTLAFYPLLILVKAPAIRYANSSIEYTFLSMVTV